MLLTREKVGSRSKGMILFSIVKEIYPKSKKCKKSPRFVGALMEKSTKGEKIQLYMYRLIIRSTNDKYMNKEIEKNLR